MPSVMHGRILIWAKSQWRFTKTATVRAIPSASYAVMLLARGIGLICHASCACGLPPAKIVFLRWFTHPQCGPMSMRLTPQDGTDTFGRDGFLIHGDNQDMNHTASHGCIILPKIIRAAISASGDHVLEVVAD